MCTSEKLLNVFMALLMTCVVICLWLASIPQGKKINASKFLNCKSYSQLFAGPPHLAHQLCSAIERTDIF